MKKNKQNEIKVGAVSIGGIILLLLVLYFTKSLGFGENKIDVLFEFDNALGMNTDAPVYVNGVKRGLVNKIWLKNGKVLVNAKMESIDDLREDCSAEIQILEITGGKKIEINPGISPNRFNPSNIIIGKESFDLGSAISKLGDISTDLSKIIIKVDALLDASINTIKDTNITKIINNTAAATMTLNNIINDAKIEKMINNLENVSSDLNKLLTDNKDGINRIANNLDTSAVELKKMIAHIEETILDAKNLLNKIDIFVDDIKVSDGTIGKLLYDTTLANRMIQMVDSLDGLVKHLKKYGINANVRLGGRP